MKGSRFLGAAACAVVLSACASTGREVPRLSAMLADETGQNGRACVRLSEIQGYGVLDDNVLSIDATRNYYLATVLPGCNDLQTSARTLFSGKFGEVCGGGKDRIATGGDSCSIRQMFEFENREQAFAAFNAVREERKALLKAAQQN